MSIQCFQTAFHMKLRKTCSWMGRTVVLSARPSDCDWEDGSQSCLILLRQSVADSKEAVRLVFIISFCSFGTCLGERF